MPGAKALAAVCVTGNGTVGAASNVLHRGEWTGLAGRLNAERLAFEPMP
jgi:hypothetical protein